MVMMEVTLVYKYSVDKVNISNSSYAFALSGTGGFAWLQTAAMLLPCLGQVNLPVVGHVDEFACSGTCGFAHLGYLHISQTKAHFITSLLLLVCDIIVESRTTSSFKLNHIALSFERFTGGMNFGFVDSRDEFPSLALSLN